MGTTISIVLSALLGIVGKLVTKQFVEAVLTRLVLWGGDKLAAMTTNELDNEIMQNVREALSKKPAPVPVVHAPDFDYEKAIQLANERRDYFAAARLMNERDGISQ